MTRLVELENINLKLNNKSSSYWCVSGKYKYYHYKCDGFDDVGWGCGYRTIQTICSWLREQMLAEIPEKQDLESKVPSVLEIQQILVKSGDKPMNFAGSRDWIGCFEAMIVIDILYDVPCRILHYPAGSGLEASLGILKEHFRLNGGPIMMGGDMDAASKGVLGISDSAQELLIVDPHLVATSSISLDVDYLLANKWISWHSISSFDRNSFYNFCIPQKKSLNK